jgi:hypothetical protein
MKSILLLICAASMAFFPPLLTALCFLPQPRLVCGEYFASQLVVEATLVRTRIIHEKGDPEGILAHVYTLHVESVFRGTGTRLIQVYEGNDSGRASFDWVRGSRYLLFLFHFPQENAWALDGCGNSGPLEKAGKALQEIRAISTANGGGLITGIVSQENNPSAPMAGVHVNAYGQKGVFTGATDATGAFKINVPEGVYTVNAISPGLSFEKYDISYDDPQKVRIEPGGCAQIQYSQKE